MTLTAAVRLPHQLCHLTNKWEGERSNLQMTIQDSFRTSMPLGGGGCKKVVEVPLFRCCVSDHY